MRNKNRSGQGEIHQLYELGFKMWYEQINIKKDSLMENIDNFIMNKSRNFINYIYI